VRRAAPPPDPVEPARGAGTVEVARLAVLTRLALGAAHVLHNAFTAVLGEAAFLAEERKDDPLVAESCDTMTLELERCARITRGLVARRRPGQGGAPGVDLVRLVRELGPLLGETLGRGHRLALRAPDELVLAAGDAATLELLVAGLVQYAADHSGGGAEIRLSIEGGAAAVVQLEVSVARLDGDVVSAVLDPRRAADAPTRALLQGLAEAVRRLGGACWAAATAPDAWAVRVRLPAA
jgi:signal transduction histidine kinase